MGGRSMTEHLRLPPHSIEAEQAVLGSLLISGDAWDEVSGVVGEADFFTQDHRTIYRAIAHQAARGEPCDAITVGDILGDDAGGLAYLGRLAMVPTTANVMAYARMVREYAIRRRGIAEATAIADAMFDQLVPLDQALDQAQARVMTLTETGSRNGPEPIGAGLKDFIEDLERRFESDAICGLTTGYVEFDELTQGLQAGDLVVLAGRPSMGKTTLGMNIAEHVALNGDGQVLVFSLEMPRAQLIQRFVASRGRVSMTKLRSGKLEDQDWPRATQVVSLLREARIMVDDTAGLSITELRSRARKAARRMGGVSLLIVDYLQLLRGDGRPENRTQEVSEISRGLKALAKELDCPVIAISQLSRDVERRGNKRPVMSDLRESGAIEQDADLICFVYRDEVYDQHSPDKGTAEINIAKQRNGPIGTIRLAFLGEYNRFENLAPDWVPAAAMSAPAGYSYE